MARKFLPPKGMRDFPPEVQILREKVFKKIEKVFQRYGFDPIETPIVERLDVLSGKYGEEAERKLMWRFKLPYSEKEFGLRYDLTVPLARFVARFQPKLPFKRYHIGRVFRYEEPQKGRYREFWQCDVDIVGTSSPLADAEIINIILDVFREFGFKNYFIKLNDRRLLRGIFERSLGIGSYSTILTIFRIVDKLEKIGIKNVILKLKEIKLSSEVIKQIEEILATTQFKRNEDVFNFLGKYDFPEVRSSVENLTKILDLTKERERIKVDLSLVRGLDYYTGMIFEGVVTEPRIGSLAGGGRYDGLIGMFLGREIPAVGGSIGVERLIDAGLELGIFKLEEKTYTRVGFVYTLDVDPRKVMEMAERLRGKGINVHVPYKPYKNILEGIKELDKRGVDYAIIVGKKEMESGKLTFQNLRTRERKELKIEEIARLLLRVSN